MSFSSMASEQQKPVHIIGGGLAGSEAAWQLARAGLNVVLHEMRPVRGTDAHQTGGLAELVCSNSFRSDDAEANAVGERMTIPGSLLGVVFMALLVAPSLLRMFGNT